MIKINLNDLTAFVTVARELSFTRAAARLGVTQSALSYAVRVLEKRLEVRLLNRTTHTIAPSEAGARLLASVGPRLDGIDADLAELIAQRDAQAGKIRLAAPEHAIDSLLIPRLAPLLADHCGLQVEISTRSSVAEIGERQFDAGVQLGQQVARNMIALRIGPDMRMVVVGAPRYFDTRPEPQTLQDLASHDCINIRAPSQRGLLSWDFKKGAREISVPVSGTWIFDGSRQAVEAAVGGAGLAFVLEDEAKPHLTAGRLVRVLDDWCGVHAAYHLCYPRRHWPSEAFGLVVDALSRHGCPGTAD